MGSEKKNRGCLFNIIMAFLVIVAITALSNGYRQKGNAEKASTKTIATAKPTAYVTAAPTKIKKATATPVPNYASMPPLTAVSTAAKQAIEDRPAFTYKSCKKEGDFFVVNLDAGSNAGKSRPFITALCETRWRPACAQGCATPSHTSP